MSTEPHSKSNLVTIVAWTSIVFAGMSVGVAVLQGFLLAMAYAQDEIRAALIEAQHATDQPELARLVFQYLPLLTVAFIVVSALSLWISIAFLKRRAWSWWPFIGLFLVVLAAHVVGPIALFPVVDSFMPLPSPAIPDFEPFFRVMLLANLITGVGFAAFMAWILRRLMAPEIRREFVT